MRIVVIIFLLFLSGCNLNPTYSRPDMDMGEA